MRIVLTGATGELGRPTLSRLIAGGHDVVCTSRSDSGSRLIEALGGRSERVDLFDRESLARATEGADAVLHLATAIPPSAKMGEPSTWVVNDRLRTETTAHLAEACVANGVGMLLLQSYFAVRAPAGDAVIDDDPAVEPAWSQIDVMASMKDAEQTARALEGRGVRSVTLRFGSLYSATSEQLQAQVAFLRAGGAAIPGDGSNYWPFIATEDAASAVVAALRLDGGAYNVSDEDPTTLEAFWTIAAETVGVPTPPRSDVTGPMADILLGSWRMSPRAFELASGWTPASRSVSTGWPAEARRYLETTPPLRPLVGTSQA